MHSVTCFMITQFGHMFYDHTIWWTILKTSKASVWTEIWTEKSGMYILRTILKTSKASVWTEIWTEKSDACTFYQSSLTLKTLVKIHLWKDSLWSVIYCAVVLWLEHVVVKVSTVIYCAVVLWLEHVVVKVSTLMSRTMLQIKQSGGNQTQEKMLQLPSLNLMWVLIIFSIMLQK